MRSRSDTAIDPIRDRGRKREVLGAFSERFKMRLTTDSRTTLHFIIVKVKQELDNRLS